MNLAKIKATSLERLACTRTRQMLSIVALSPLILTTCLHMLYYYPNFLAVNLKKLTCCLWSLSRLAVETVQPNLCSFEASASTQYFHLYPIPQHPMQSLLLTNWDYRAFRKCEDGYRHSSFQVKMSVSIQM